MTILNNTAHMAENNYSPDSEGVLVQKFTEKDQKVKGLDLLKKDARRLVEGLFGRVAKNKDISTLGENKDSKIGDPIWTADMGRLETSSMLPVVPENTNSEPKLDLAAQIAKNEADQKQSFADTQAAAEAKRDQNQANSGGDAEAFGTDLLKYEEMAEAIKNGPTSPNEDKERQIVVEHEANAQAKLDEEARGSRVPGDSTAYDAYQQQRSRLQERAARPGSWMNREQQESEIIAEGVVDNPVIVYRDRAAVKDTEKGVDAKIAAFEDVGSDPSTLILKKKAETQLDSSADNTQIFAEDPTPEPRLESSDRWDNADRPYPIDADGNPVRPEIRVQDEEDNPANRTEENRVGTWVRQRNVRERQRQDQEAREHAEAAERRRQEMSEAWQRVRDRLPVNVTFEQLTEATRSAATRYAVSAGIGAAVEMGLVMTGTPHSGLEPALIAGSTAGLVNVFEQQRRNIGEAKSELTTAGQEQIRSQYEETADKVFRGDIPDNLDPNISIMRGRFNRARSEDAKRRIVRESLARQFIRSANANGIQTSEESDAYREEFLRTVDSLPDSMVNEYMDQLDQAKKDEKIDQYRPRAMEVVLATLAKTNKTEVVTRTIAAAAVAEGVHQLVHATGVDKMVGDAWGKLTGWLKPGTPVPTPSGNPEPFPHIGGEEVVPTPGVESAPSTNIPHHSETPWLQTPSEINPNWKDSLAWDGKVDGILGEWMYGTPDNTAKTGFDIWNTDQITKMKTNPGYQAFQDEMMDIIKKLNPGDITPQAGKSFELPDPEVVAEVAQKYGYSKP